jgi:hypothetical protein
MMFRVVPGAQELLLPGHRVVVRIVAGLFGSELLVQRRTFGRRGEAYRLLRKWRTRGYLFNDAADVRPYMRSMS